MSSVYGVQEYINSNVCMGISRGVRNEYIIYTN